MFWNTLGLDCITETIELNKKISDPNITLEEILEDLNCFQEIRNKSPAIMEFLKKEVIFRNLMLAILKPNLGESFKKNTYKFAHRCCEALSIASMDFYTEFLKYNDLIDMMINFLPNCAGNLNHLCVSFYCKVVINFLASDTYSFLTILEKGSFVENCIDNLEFCSVFELICSIINCLPDASYRTRIKQWFVQKNFVFRLLDCLTPEKPTEIHENAAALWIELIKSLRDAQFNVEVCEDVLLESLQSEDNIRKLLTLMFPKNNNEISFSIIINGCQILNTLLETNYIPEIPSTLIYNDLQNIYYSKNADDYSISMRNVSCFIIDSERIIETICAEYSTKIMIVIISTLQIKENDDVLVGCLQLLLNLLNTNFLPTHLKLLETFSSEKTHLKILFRFISENSSFSIFNCYFTDMLLFILYSFIGAENPLANFLISICNLPFIICCSLEECKEKNYINILSKRTFYLNLASKLFQSQMSTKQGEFINSLITKSPNYQMWLNFVTFYLKHYIDRNKCDKILYNVNRLSNVIEIDEFSGTHVILDDVDFRRQLKSKIRINSEDNEIKESKDEYFDSKNMPPLKFFADFASAFGESSNIDTNLFST